MIKQKELKKFIKVKNEGYVYICLANDNTIKIGITTYPYTRLHQIETSSGKEIVDWYVEKSCVNYKSIESQMHNIFKNNRLKGEWFTSNFNEAVNKLKVLKKKYICESNKDDNEKIKILNLLKLALEIKYEEYEEWSLKYNFDSWTPTNEDIDTVKNVIKENIEYNNKEYNGDDNECLEEYLEIINKNEYGKESKQAMQNYYINYIDCFGYFDLAKEMLEENGEYNFIKKVLGIKEFKRNLFVEKLLKEFVEKNF